MGFLFRLRLPFIKLRFFIFEYKGGLEPPTFNYSLAFVNTLPIELLIFKYDVRDSNP